MRFLQLEWHNHERARNAWDIERAEMKAKIAKQEGEVRSAKKLNDQLNKHIRMLEHALTNERTKNKNGGEAQSADDKKDAKGSKAGLKRASAPRIIVWRRDTDCLQPRTNITIPSSMSTPNSSTAPILTARACAKSPRCILPSALRRSPTF